MSPENSLVANISTSPQSSGDQPLKIVAKISNTSSKPVTILNWNSLLDPKAPILGVLKVYELLDEYGRKRVVEGVTLMFKRKLPAPREDLVEIEAGGEAQIEYELKEFVLEEGKKYTVQGKGRWMHVWELKKDEVTEEMLETFEGSSAGTFESNEITVDK